MGLPSGRRAKAAVAAAVTLPPGSYTAIVSDVNSRRGATWAEAYELTGN